MLWIQKYILHLRELVCNVGYLAVVVVIGIEKKPLHSDTSHTVAVVVVIGIERKPLQSDTSHTLIIIIIINL